MLYFGSRAETGYSQDELVPHRPSMRTIPPCGEANFQLVLPIANRLSPPGRRSGRYRYSPTKAEQRMYAQERGSRRNGEGVLKTESVRPWTGRTYQ